MMMKKTIAGVFASVVAVSAMATTIASAADIQYAAIDNTYAFKTTGYSAKDADAKTLKVLDNVDCGVYTTPGAYTGTATLAQVSATEQLIVESNTSTAYVIKFSSTTQTGDPTAQIAADGKTITVYTSHTAANNTEDKILVALNSVVSGTVFTAPNSTVANSATDVLVSWFDTTVAVTSTVATGTTSNAYNVGDTLKFVFSSEVKDVEVIIDNNDTAVPTMTITKDSTNGKLVEANKGDDDDDDSFTTWTLSGVSGAAGNYDVDVKYTVAAKDDSSYDDRDDAEDENKDEEVKLTVTATGSSDMYNKIAAKYDNTYIHKAEFEVESGKETGPKLEENKYKSLLEWDAVKGSETAEDVVDAVSEDLEARTKAQVVFNFDAADFTTSDDVEVTVKFDTRDFGILKTTVDMNENAGTATIDWADLITSQTSKATLGDISNKIKDIEIKYESDDADDDDDLVLKSISVVGPAETYSTIAAGAAADDTAAAITTAAETTAAPVVTAAPVETTTAPAANPSTGNAPIALAAIPVAIAAAAVIAKKRG